MNSKIKQGGSIRYLIAVLLSALLVICLAPSQNKTTSVTKHVNNQALVISQKKAVAPITEKISVEVKPVAKPKPKKATSTTYAHGCNTYRSIFTQYSWDVDIALAICQAESSGNPYAYSSTQDAGLMQIHDGLILYGSQIYNPSFNISKAYQKYQSQGWHAWTTYNRGYYLKYL